MRALAEGLGWCMCVTGAIVLGVLLCLPAPYGRYSKHAGWGPLVDAKLAWMVMESPNLYVSAAVVYWSTAAQLAHTPNRVLLAAFLLHYVHRALVFPLRMRNGKPMPLSVMLLAWSFCAYNGFLQSLSLAHVYEYSSEWLFDIRFMAGLCLWGAGFYINVSSDAALSALRKGNDAGYKIPRGGMFELVSGANYFGEIVEWIGFAIACWSLPAAAFAVFTFCNLAPRAYQHHRWYLHKFDDYPKGRRAVIPFVW